MEQKDNNMNKPIVLSILHGRLGNVMFQIATNLYYAKKHNMNSYFWFSEQMCHKKDKDFFFNNHIENIFGTKINIIQEKEIKQFLNNGKKTIKANELNPITYTEIPFENDCNTIIYGNRQSYKYFTEDFCKEIFQLSNEDVITQVRNDFPMIEELTCIHIRRGDYITEINRGNDIFNILTIDQIHRVVQNEKSVIIVSDDIEWCKSNIKEENVLFSDGKSFLYDFVIQTLCKKNVISNSTFSWWGAFLNIHQDREVNYFSPWFNHGLSDEDIIPHNNKWLNIKPLNVLLGCLHFTNLTGSEVYYYEIAKSLMKMGHTVTVGAMNINNGQLLELINSEIGLDKIQIVPINKINENNIKNFDLIIASHVPIVQHLCKIKRNSKVPIRFISINHHEYYNEEIPVLDDMINQYIGIRPNICETLKNKYNIKNVRLVWNPFDFNRFGIKSNCIFDKNKKNTILFCGTIDATRKESIYDLAHLCTDKKWKMILVGANCNDYLNDLLATYPCIEYHDSTNDIVSYIDKCDATAGVFIGRTTIEGWLRGKPGIVYILNNDNHIISRELQTRPEDYEKFNETNVIKEILFN